MNDRNQSRKEWLIGKIDEEISKATNNNNPIAEPPKPIKCSLSLDEANISKLLKYFKKSDTTEDKTIKISIDIAKFTEE